MLLYVNVEMAADDSTTVYQRGTSMILITLIDELLGPLPLKGRLVKIIPRVLWPVLQSRYGQGGVLIIDAFGSPMSGGKSAIDASIAKQKDTVDKLFEIIKA
jgi:hypothetical protein